MLALSGYAVIETDNLAEIHVPTTALAAFTFRLEPVVDTMDAVAIELQVMAWREKVAYAHRHRDGLVALRPSPKKRTRAPPTR